ncbi:MAG TPA: DUF1992 domain-containing protein [Pyrinomonadaceae bacterium]|nr:DUF1992 domain-containing protein [Pyrinomonadaceae bacterium]
MSLESFIEQQIKKAIAEGEFDDLPGKGKPVDLKAYFDTPEDLRMAYSILKDANVVPEEVQLLKDIEALKAQLETCSDEEQKDRIKRAITEKRLAFNLLIENQRRKK